MEVWLMARLATTDGKRPPSIRYLNAGRSAWQSLQRRLFGRIPRLPWIPFAAAEELDRRITKDFIVREIGAGYSTLWLADRVGQLTSIESSREWHAKLAAMMEREGLGNVDLRYEWRAERMSDFSDLADESLDLLFVDGGPRTQCLAQGWVKVKSGGIIYLDNWENHGFWRDAPAFLESVSASIAEQRSFVDYVPAQVGVYEGLLLAKA